MLNVTHSPPPRRGRQTLLAPRGSSSGGRVTGVGGKSGREGGPQPRATKPLRATLGGLQVAELLRALERCPLGLPIVMGMHFLKKSQQRLKKYSDRQFSNNKSQRYFWSMSRRYSG